MPQCVRKFAVLFSIAFAIAGCKSTGLGEKTATTALESTVFAPAAATQTLTFVVGRERPAKPYAIDGFLYAKRWLACRDAEPGLFSAHTVCTFEDAGRAYAAANGWTVARGDATGACAKCETWTVPLARAKLRSVSDVHETGKDTASATYGFDVTPNEFGAQLDDWMKQNALAWCGADPRAIGLWGTERSANATFVRSSQGWKPAEPASFTTSFANRAVAPDRPCAPTP